MSNRKDLWSSWAEVTATPLKKFFTRLSVRLRTAQFTEFEKFIKPTSKDRVLDVGVTSDETLIDANLFEKLYKWPERLTIATIEDSKKIMKRYPKIKVVSIKRGKRLPFKSKSFDIVVSWATLEHVGSREKQQYFINELIRISKRIFVITPDRSALYEPHSGFLFLHWLPLKWFRKICLLTDNKFWSEENNLNPLFVSDLKKMRFTQKTTIKVYKIFNLFPAHIIISA